MRKPVLLIGMMGCGKSTVGRLLAERMRLPLIDLDEEIARAAGKTIPEIFAQEGEAGFRARETAALERALAREDGVIATGGGIVTRAENIRMMREKGFVVWLCRPLEDSPAVFSSYHFAAYSNTYGDCGFSISANSASFSRRRSRSSAFVLP